MDYTRQEELVVKAVSGKPKSVDDLSDELRTSYSTMWRIVKGLEKKGVLRDTPYRDGKKKMWFLASNEGWTDPIVRISTSGGAVQLHRLCVFDHPVADSVHDVDAADVKGLQLTLNQLKQPRNLGGALAQVWRYSRFAGSSTVDKAYAGSMTPLECKAVLRRTLNWLDEYRSLVEQVLLSPIWEEELGAPAIVERFGEIPADVQEFMIRLGQAFEKRNGR